MEEAQESFAHAALQQVRDDLFELTSRFVFGAGLALLLLATDSHRPRTWLPAILVLAAVGIARAAEQQVRGYGPLVLGYGVVGAILVMDEVYGAAWLGGALGLALVLLGTLGGARHAVGGAALVGAVEFGARPLVSGSPTPFDLGFALIGVAAGGALLTWVIERPTQLALAWSWQAYQDSEAKTRELRNRQGELHRVLRQLDDACYRLEQANDELARARQAAETARRLKAEFAATISHELRTPLNLIIGLSEMLVLNTRADFSSNVGPRGDWGELRDDLAIIYRNASQIANLVDDVLDLSQIDAHRLALEKQPSCLHQLVSDVVAMVESLFRRKGLELLVDIPSDLPDLYVDRNRIRQILINLLNNAVRFTNEGGVTIRAKRRDSDVVVSVSDTGIGISKADLPFVFSEFRQVGAGLSHRYGGSGFGLYISKRFVELHGGSMWVESEEGVGTTFSFTLPLTSTVVGEAATIAWDRLTRAALGSRVTVGVVGSTRAVRVFQRYLDGFDVVEYPRDLAPEGRQRKTIPQALIVADPRVRIDASALPLVSCPLYEPETFEEEGGLVVAHLVKPVTRDRLLSVLRQLGRETREILVVDDDPDLARLLAQMARGTRRRYQVSLAYDGDEALRRLRESPPDAVLLDLLMPGMDGRGVLREMGADERLRKVPVIVISAPRRGEDVIVAGPVSVSRSEGLTVGEAMRLVKAGLEVLFPSHELVGEMDRAP